MTGTELVTAIMERMTHDVTKPTSGAVARLGATRQQVTDHIKALLFDPIWKYRRDHHDQAAMIEAFHASFVGLPIPRSIAQRLERPELPQPDHRCPDRLIPEAMYEWREKVRARSGDGRTASWTAAQAEAHANRLDKR